MTKGDKIKLRAELAGKAMAAIIGSDHAMKMSNRVIEEFPNSRRDAWVAEQSVQFADALMAELGISLDKED